MQVNRPCSSPVHQTEEVPYSTTEELKAEMEEMYINGVQKGKLPRIFVSFGFLLLPGAAAPLQTT
jgi:hypothetical protein